MKLIKRLNIAIDTAAKSSLFIKDGLAITIGILQGKKLNIGTAKNNSKTWGIYVGSIFYDCANKASAVETLRYNKIYAEFIKKYGSENFPIMIDNIYEDSSIFAKFAKDKKTFAENKKLFDNFTKHFFDKQSVWNIWNKRKTKINNKYGDTLNNMIKGINTYIETAAVKLPKVASAAWWKKASSSQKLAYIKLHPDSKFARRHTKGYGAAKTKTGLLKRLRSEKREDDYFALNRKISSGTMSEKDLNEFVDKLIAEKKANPGKLTVGSDRLNAIAKRPDAPFEKLWNEFSDNGNIREKILSNPNAPRHLFEKAITDSYSGLRAAVARYGTDDDRDKLLDDPSPTVQITAALFGNKRQYDYIKTKTNWSEGAPGRRLEAWEKAGFTLEEKLDDLNS